MPHLSPVFAAMADAGATVTRLAVNGLKHCLSFLANYLLTKNCLIGWIASYRPCAQFLAQCCEAKRPRT